MVLADRGEVGVMAGDLPPVGDAPAELLRALQVAARGWACPLVLCSSSGTTLPRLGVGMARQGMARRGSMPWPGLSRFGASRALVLLGGRCRLLRLIGVGSGVGLAWLSLPAARTNGAEQGYPVRPAPPATSVVANLAPATLRGVAEPGRCPTATMAQGRRSVAGASLRYPLTRWAEEISPFGWRYSSARGTWSMHSGIDLISPPGTPVVAVMGGQVARVDTIGGYGLAVIVDHGNGWQSLYAHLQAVAVRPCMVLQAGGQLGWVGRSGSASTDHLHLELRSGIGPSQVAVDPARYLPRP